DRSSMDFVLYGDRPLKKNQLQRQARQPVQLHATFPESHGFNSTCLICRGGSNGRCNTLLIGWSASSSKERPSPRLSSVRPKQGGVFFESVVAFSRELQQFDPDFGYEIAEDAFDRWIPPDGCNADEPIDVHRLPALPSLP